MPSQHTKTENPRVSGQAVARRHRFGQWIQNPMNSVIFASLTTMSTLGFVLSGMWVISASMS